MENQPTQHFVTLLKNKEGNSITNYGNTGYGFIEVGCDRVLAGQNEFVVTRLKGAPEILNTILSDYFVNDIMPGTIIVKEFLESQVPESIKRNYYHKKKTDTEAATEFLKKDSKTGLPIIINGERVVRITEFIEKPDMSRLFTLIVECHSAK